MVTTGIRVARLVEALKKLPQDALVRKIGWHWEAVVKERGHDIFYVYERDGETELHIVDTEVVNAGMDEFHTELEF